MRSRVSGTTFWVAVVGLVAVAGCSDSVAVPTDVDLQFAKGGGGGGPAVDSSDPSEAPQDVTLDVRVIGSGFDQGSTVRFLLAGQSTPKIITNSSTFVDRNEVIANITIEADAELALYDIELTTGRGKKGIGSELFAVKPKDDVGPFYQISTFGNPESRVSAVSATDVLAGSEGGHAAILDLTGSAALLPDLGAESSGVREISGDAAYAVGWAQTSGQAEQALIWDLAAGAVVEVPTLPGLLPQLFDVNGAGTAVGLVKSPSADVEQWPAIWELTGPGSWSVRLLGTLPQHTQGWAMGINEAGHVVGRSQLPSFVDPHAVLWIANGEGTFDVVDLTPLADGTGDNLGRSITDPDPSGQVIIAGRSTRAYDGRLARWTVDVATRTVTEDLAPVSGSWPSDISIDGDVLSGTRVWSSSDDVIYELPHSGSRCWSRTGAFDRGGRVFGSAQVSTRNSSSCSAERSTTEVAAYWTLIGG